MNPSANAPSLPRYSIVNTYVDPANAAYRFRARRFMYIKPHIDRIIAEKGHCRIADIGGTDYYWNMFADYVNNRPIEITLINLDAHTPRSPKLKSIVGNATDLSAHADNSFDFVHSNSVIEHVGSWDSMCRMAAHVRRLAPIYYVQTPNFWFPYEPHFRVPCFHWLPEQVRAELLMRFNLGFGGRRTSYDAAMRGVQSASLLNERQMRALFPDALVVKERAFGLTKSLMAIRAQS